MIKNLSNAASILAGLCATTAALLVGCGGGGGGSSTTTAPVPVQAPAPSTYLLGGTVTGLAPGGSLTLSNGSDVVAVDANGNFSFPNKLSPGDSYIVSSISSPGHICTLTNAAATVSKADVTTIKASCVPDVRLLAGMESVLQDARAMTVDADGNTFVYDYFYSVIRKITPSGVISTYAGVPKQKGVDDGAAATARFQNVTGMIVDREGSLIIIEQCAGVVRKVTKTGMVSTVAGQSRLCPNGYVDSKDGQGKSAVFRGPTDIALDVNGDYLINERQEYALRRVTPGGLVTTMHWVYTPIPKSYDELRLINHFAIDKNGNILASQYGSAPRIWKISAGVATALAGGAAFPRAGQGDAAGFAQIDAMAADAAGNLHVADSGVLYSVTPDGTVSTVAGFINQMAFINGPIDGLARAANLGTVSALAVDRRGNVVILEGGRGLLRSVTAAGAVSTFASTAVAQQYLDGVGSAARFASVSRPAVDAQGNLYAMDSQVVRKITPAGIVSWYAGVVGQHGQIDGSVKEATFYTPVEIAIDGAGSQYVVDGIKLRKISGGMVSTLFESLALAGTTGIAVSAQGTLAVATLKEIRLYAQNGTLLNIVDRDRVKAMMPTIPDYFLEPRAPVFDSSGNLYFADRLSSVLLKLSKDYLLTKFSGKPNVPLTSRANIDGSAETAIFSAVGQLTADSKGNLYLIAGGVIRMISPSGAVSTLATPWENPPLSGVAYGNGKLYAMSKYAILQMPVP